jgi:beta-fructofuranosidase
MDIRQARWRNPEGQRLVWHNELAALLWLGEDNTLRMRPPEELEVLRYNPKEMGDITVKADSEIPLEGIAGNSLELNMEMVPDGAEQFGVKVCCSPDGEEQTIIFYDATDKKLKIDTTKSSLGEGSRSVEAAPFELEPDESMRLRVFVDKSVVEIFANERQGVMRRIYPTRADSLEVMIFSRGGAMEAKSIHAWDMAPTNPY